MTPKWQRARIIAQPDTPECVGQLIWVEVAAPSIRSFGRNYITGKPAFDKLSYLTNLIPEGFGDLSIEKECVELLARDENDFAEDVPLIPWETFLEQCRAKERTE